MTPLSWCVHGGHFDATEAILDNAKTDVNMHFLVRQRQRGGAGRDQNSGTLMTAMDLAISRNDEDMVALLTEYKAKSYGALQAKQSLDTAPDHVIDDEEAFQRFLNLEA